MVRELWVEPLGCQRLVSSALNRTERTPCRSSSSASIIPTGPPPTMPTKSSRVSSVMLGAPRDAAALDDIGGVEQLAQMRVVRFRHEHREAGAAQLRQHLADAAGERGGQAL